LWKNSYLYLFLFSFHQTPTINTFWLRNKTRCMRAAWLHSHNQRVEWLQPHSFNTTNKSNERAFLDLRKAKVWNKSILMAFMALFNIRVANTRYSFDYLAIAMIILRCLQHLKLREVRPNRVERTCIELSYDIFKIHLTTDCCKRNVLTTCFC
jgi:hypothetical protein